MLAAIGINASVAIKITAKLTSIVLLEDCLTSVFQSLANVCGYYILVMKARSNFLQSIELYAVQVLFAAHFYYCS